MSQDDLKDALRPILRRNGIRAVLHALGDLQAVSEPVVESSVASQTKNSRKGKRSAIDYVRRMTLPPAKADVMVRVAECFEDRAFLPAIADIREFCRVHDVDIGKTASRASAVPRVFSFLAAMDAGAVSEILDSGEFSGPSSLAPIADAIRSHGAGRQRGEGAAGQNEPQTLNTTPPATTSRVPARTPIAPATPTAAR